MIPKALPTSKRTEWFAHSIRLLVLVSNLMLFHAIHQRAIGRAKSNSIDSIPAERIESVFGSGCRISQDILNEHRAVIDPNNTIVGHVVQTSPASDEFIGFSGPTNVLIAMGADGLVRHVSILRSGDTRDHIKQIENDSVFLSFWNGKKASDLTHLSETPNVTGATLSSASIVQGIQKRFGASISIGKFPEQVSVEDAQLFFSETQKVVQDSSFPSLWFAIDQRGRECGWLLRTSPVADDVIGYQGPTDALIAMSMNRQIVGIHVGKSFDNEPYVGYVRKDRGFASFWKQFTLQSLAKADLKQQGMEGVSGATMSSMAIADSIVKAANSLDQSMIARANSSQLPGIRWERAVGTAIVIAIAMALCFSHWRGSKWARVAFQFVVIVYLGLLQGELLSVAMFAGWTQNGIPWASATGLMLLTVSAVIVPVATKRNIYCSHLCPHGAVQQLLPRRWQWKKAISPWLLRLLISIRPLLLIWIVVVLVSRMSFSLVDIEPFDAYSWRAAAWASVFVAIIGLVFSLFVPMGYCRYGCVTGGILNYLRRNPHSVKLQRSDCFSISCLLICGVLYASGS